MYCDFIFNLVIFLGALAAISAFGWTLWHHYRPIRITVPSHTVEDGERGKISILIRNPRPRPLNIHKIRLFVSRDKKQKPTPWGEPIITNLTLPFAVQEEKRLDVSLPADITFAANVLSPFYIEIETEMGKVYRSKQVKYKSSNTR